MNQGPLVSIALCTYNGAFFLPQQLDSLVAQSYHNIEVVVVDDCSADSTVSILKDYAARYPIFKVYENEKNLGFTGNFEKAVSLCSGELIALCDQDDIWHPQKIELQVEGIKDHMFIYHDSEFIHADGTPMGHKMSDVMNFYRGGQPEVFLFFNCVSGHAILMKRALLDYALPLNQDFFHDWWLAYVATNIGTIDFIPQCLVQYRQHDNSDTNILRRERKKDSYRFSSVEKLTRTYRWIEKCATFRYLKHPQIISEVYEAYQKRMNSRFSPALSLVLFKYRHILLFIRKRSVWSNVNFIVSQLWGLKTKNTFNRVH